VHEELLGGLDPRPPALLLDRALQRAGLEPVLDDAVLATVLQASALQLAARLGRGMVAGRGA
jgi:hypothetical protein